MQIENHHILYRDQVSMRLISGGMVTNVVVQVAEELKMATYTVCLQKNWCTASKEGRMSKKISRTAVIIPQLIIFLLLLSLTFFTDGLSSMFFPRGTKVIGRPVIEGDLDHSAVFVNCCRQSSRTSATPRPWPSFSTARRMEFPWLSFWDNRSWSLESSSWGLLPQEKR